MRGFVVVNNNISFLSILLLFLLSFDFTLNNGKYYYCSALKPKTSSLPEEQQQQESNIDNVKEQTIVVDDTNVVLPEGYTLSARVYTDEKDKLSYFDPDVDNNTSEKEKEKIITSSEGGKLKRRKRRNSWTLPYYERCGSTKTATRTTERLSLKHAYFRRILAFSSFQWEGSEFGPHTASLLVTLEDNTILELNSGQSRTFPAGSVILLEDVVGDGGHHIKLGTNNNNNEKKESESTNDTTKDNANSSIDREVTVLMLTLPPSRGVVLGKDETAFKAKRKLTSCGGFNYKRWMIKHIPGVAIGAGISYFFNMLLWDFIKYHIRKVNQILSSVLMLVGACGMANCYYHRASGENEQEYEYSTTTYYDNNTSTTTTTNSTAAPKTVVG